MDTTDPAVQAQQDRSRLWRAFNASLALVAVLLGLVVVQAAFGIIALVLVVPFDWALLHHGFAMIVLGFAAAHWRGTKGAYPMERASTA